MKLHRLVLNENFARNISRDCAGKVISADTRTSLKNSRVSRERTRLPSPNLHSLIVSRVMRNNHGPLSLNPSLYRRSDLLAEGNLQTLTVSSKVQLSLIKTLSCATPDDNLSRGDASYFEPSDSTRHCEHFTLLATRQRRTYASNSLSALTALVPSSRRPHQQHCSNTNTEAEDRRIVEFITAYNTQHSEYKTLTLQSRCSSTSTSTAPWTTTLAKPESTQPGGKKSCCSVVLDETMITKLLVDSLKHVAMSRKGSLGSWS